MNHGIFLLPDTNAHGGPDKPQHVYNVRFSARELWGEDAPANDCVYIDCSMIIWIPPGKAAVHASA